MGGKLSSPAATNILAGGGYCCHCRPKRPLREITRNQENGATMGQVLQSDYGHLFVLKRVATSFSQAWPPQAQPLPGSSEESE